ncbi:MAG: DUF177 domain-containing protein [Bacteroidales bacterium]|nr:DUF177 domain-containing protein [Bacteroidales bacterium]
MRGFYSIPLTGLKEGSHSFDFKIGSDFFNSYEESLIQEATLQADIDLVRRSAHMEMLIKLNGTVELICDRCLELYTQEMHTEDRILIKFGEQWEEVDDEVIMVPFGENDFQLDHLFYEFAHLGLPLKKVHPDDENGDSTCDPDMLERLDQHIINEDEKIDPRWKELEKLKNNNNKKNR